MVEKITKGKYQSGQMGQTVNLLAYAFGGSNPSLPTPIKKNVSSSTVTHSFFALPLPYFVLNTKSRVTACRPSSLSEIPNYVEFSKRSANGFGQILSMVFCKFLSHITLLLSPQTKSTFHSKIDSTEYLNTQISKNSTDKLCACQKNLYLCNK